MCMRVSVCMYNAIYKRKVAVAARRTKQFLVSLNSSSAAFPSPACVSPRNNLLDVDLAKTRIIY